MPGARAFRGSQCFRLTFSEWPKPARGLSGAAAHGVQGFAIGVADEFASVALPQFPGDGRIVHALATSEADVIGAAVLRMDWREFQRAGAGVQVVAHSVAGGGEEEGAAGVGRNPTAPGGKEAGQPVEHPLATRTLGSGAMQTAMAASRGRGKSLIQLTAAGRSGLPLFGRKQASRHFRPILDALFPTAPPPWFRARPGPPFRKAWVNRLACMPSPLRTSFDLLMS